MAQPIKSIEPQSCHFFSGSTTVHSESESDQNMLNRSSVDLFFLSFFHFFINSYILRSLIKTKIYFLDTFN